LTSSCPILDRLVPAFKIASGDNNFFPLLETVARTGKPIILSAGLMGWMKCAAARSSSRAYGDGTASAASWLCCTASSATLPSGTGESPGAP
jgi:N-acetylneuraminate synthase/N,N'-diacetyllegionaminate synthase